ncbi:MAG: hypothetical protein COA78_29455 [Blastopirellula sp.]|nr:MAG: hypothetical protein COA78_29455 [Blastopirellula sp.]
MKGLLFTLGLTYGGSVIALFRPWYGVLIYATFAIIRPEATWPWSVPPDNYSRIIAIALIIGWAINGFGNWNFGKAKPIVYCLLGYWAWLIISACFAPHQDVAWLDVELHSKILLPLFIGCTLIDSVEKIKQLCWVIVLCLGFHAFEANIDTFQGGYQLELYGWSGLDNNGACIGFVTAAGIAFFLGLGETVWWKRWPAFIFAALLAHTPMFGSSRGGMLGLACIGVASVYLIPKKPIYITYLCLGFIVAGSLAGPRVMEEFATIFAGEEQRDGSADSRIELWKDCTDAMLNNPLTGLGPNHWEYAAVEIYGWETRKASHSTWFNIAAELGIPGIMFFLGFYFFTIKLAWKVLKQPQSEENYWHPHFARIILASLAGFLVSASFVNFDQVEVPYYIVLMCVGLLKLQTQKSPVTEPQRMTTNNPNYLTINC